jgi:hypothetical protein
MVKLNCCIWYYKASHKGPKGQSAGFSYRYIPFLRLKIKSNFLLIINNYNY